MSEFSDDVNRPLPMQEKLAKKRADELWEDSQNGVRMVTKMSLPPLGPNMQRMDGSTVYMPDEEVNLDRVIHNSPPPMDDVGGVDKELFDEKDPNAPELTCKAGKLRVFSLLLYYFPDALMEVCKASEAGARKYGAGNWRKVPNGIEEYEDAAARHMMRMARGDVLDIDQDIVLRHKAQAVWSLLASLQLELEEANYEWVS